MIDERLKGKKLVVLGGAPNESTLVKRAQELGLHVIVADYYTDRKLSPAKVYADEAWDVNWTDLDLMEELCRKNGVDGVTAGYSEVKIEYLIKLCQRLELPCYCNEEQLEITRNKAKFKDMCRKCGVPVVKDYSCVDEVDTFPVIVKPTDRAGSVGIGIAANRKELDDAYTEAIEKSYEGNAVIEEYITDRKVDIYYLVDRGNISLLSSCDVIMAANNGSEKVVQSCWLYPHRELSSFLKNSDPALRKMIKELGIEFGCVLFSGFIDSEFNYKFFECAFRLEGAHQYNYTYNAGSVNFLDVFIYHSIFGHIDDVKRNTSGDPRLKLAIINLYLNEGTIGTITGIDEVGKLEDCSLALVKTNPGDQCRNGSILAKSAMFEFNNTDAEKLAADVDFLYKSFCVLDTEGKDMIFDRVDSNIIRKWWS